MTDRIAEIKERLAAAPIGVFMVDDEDGVGLFVIAPAAADDEHVLTQADLDMLGNAPADLQFLLDEVGQRGTTATFTREELLEALTLEPCHVTGMHDPSHTPQYVCDIQRSKAFKRVLALVGVNEKELPRRLHGERCYLCTNHREPTLLAWANPEQEPSLEAGQ